MKQLKPGQLCTIKGYTRIGRTKHIFRCKKGDIDNNTISVCSQCAKENYNPCILVICGIIHPVNICKDVFGVTNYPVLVK